MKSKKNMDNIEVFNRIVIVIFKELYENFPKPMLIIVSKIRSEVEIAEDAWWEVMKENPISSAITWLSDEGFIRYGGCSPGSQFLDVVLTAKGFAALNKSPKSLSTEPTNGDKMREYSKSLTKEAVSGIVKGVIGIVFSH